MIINKACDEYINFLKGIVQEYESKMTSSISTIAIAITTIFFFKKYEIIVYGCIAVISYYLTGFLLSLYRTRQWRKVLENAAEELERDIEADRQQRMKYD